MCRRYADIVHMFALQFLLLYKELYYRHIYSKLVPTIEQRIESWLNYCDIFNLLLSVDSPLSLELPNQWLWDMIDEFIYQFQARGINSCELALKFSWFLYLCRPQPVARSMQSCTCFGAIP